MMSKSDQPQAVRSYLSELKRALADVPREVADEIENGVAEELAGLSAADVFARIEELGDPAFIAAEARASSASDSPTAPEVPLAAPLPTDAGAPGPTAVTTKAGWHLVIVSLLVAFGGIVIPVLGWVIGLVLMWRAPWWRTWEKWVGTLTAPVFTMVLVFTIYWSSSRESAGGAGASGDVANPLVPTLYDVVWFSIIFFTLLNVIVGVWLLWRGAHRDGG